MRQGNRNKKVFIYRYITEGSFDAYSWQLLETKQRFITGLLSGSMTARSGSDIEDTVLNYAEVKALAVGNPLVKERVEAANELAKYLTLQKRLVDSRLRMEKELLQEILEKKDEEAARREQLWEQIGSALGEHLLAPEELQLLRYRGFDVVLPANVTKERPYLWLVREGRYRVDLSTVKLWSLIRPTMFSTIWTGIWKR